MLTKKKFQLDFSILLPIILFAIIGITSINSAESLLLEENHYALKQIIWYIIGSIGIIFVIIVGNKRIMKYSWYLYGLFVLLLLLILFFGEPINNSKCWLSFLRLEYFNQVSL